MQASYGSRLDMLSLSLSLTYVLLAGSPAVRGAPLPHTHTHPTACHLNLVARNGALDAERCRCKVSVRWRALCCTCCAAMRGRTCIGPSATGPCTPTRAHAHLLLPCRPLVGACRVPGNDNQGVLAPAGAPMISQLLPHKLAGSGCWDPHCHRAMRD